MSNNKANEKNTSLEQGDWVRYSQNTIAGERVSALPTQYVVLIVLEGEVELTFNRFDNKRVPKGSLVVIDCQQLTSFQWKANTALLEFSPPKKMFRYFTSSHPSLQPPCSTILPVRPLLQQWIDDLMKECQQPAERLSLALRRAYCARLGNIIKTYPPLQVHRLLFPFLACSASGEAKCNGELFI